MGIFLYYLKEYMMCVNKSSFLMRLVVPTVFKFFCSAYLEIGFWKRRKGRVSVGR